MTFECKLEGGDGVSLADAWGKNLPGRRKSRSPEVRVQKASLFPKGSRAHFNRILVFSALRGQDFLLICSLHLPTGLDTTPTKENFLFSGGL